jgi:hypothetical protein
MTWLVVGQYFGNTVAPGYSHIKKRGRKISFTKAVFAFYLKLAFFSIPAIGSFVVIAKMIRSDNLCTML